MQIQDIQTQLGVTADGIWGEKSKQAMRSAMRDGKVIKITENISLNELLASNTASRLGLDNMPDAKVIQNLIDSAIKLFQPAREILGKPIRISSGYRSPKLNAKINGAKNSAHLYGFAMDFVCPEVGNTKQVLKKLTDGLKAKGIKFDQAIIEYPSSPNSWIHLGYKHPSGTQRGQVFRIG